MRVTYAGCNLFGQVVSSTALSIERFDAYLIDHPLVVDVALGHSIIAYLKTDGLYFHGHGLEPRKTHQITKIDLPVNPKVIRAADTRIFLLDVKGDIHVLDFLNKEPKFVQKPNIIMERDEGDEIVDFVAGSKINIALTAAGNIYNIPNKLDFQLSANAKVKKLSAGHEHALILDDHGNIYTLGNGRRGQLGHGNLDNLEDPHLVETLAGISIVDVAAGGWHSVALSCDGDVYIWGWNSDGQLGLHAEDGSTISVVQTPQYLSLPDELNVAHIAAGSRHSICITTDNNVYAFGCNKFNQLGIEDSEAIVDKPTKVFDIKIETKIINVTCGPTSTMILMDE